MLCDQLASGASSAEMKSEIQRTVGVKNADNYFRVLGRYLSGKMSKSVCDRLCVRSLGRDNLSLHNRFILTILKNATCLEEPPVNKRGAVGLLSVQIDNGYKGSCLQSLCKDGFPVSPRKRRTPTFRGRKFRDKFSPPGPLDKTPNVISEGSPSKVLEQSGATELRSLGSRPPFDINSVEDGEEVEQTAGSPSVRSTSLVTAPFGICINRRGSKKLLSNDSSTGAFTDTCFTLSELPDTNSLRERLVKKVKAEGLDVSLDFVNCLNHGVDIFLKRLISPTLEIASSRSNTVICQQEQSRMGPGQNGNSNKPIQSVFASTLDFRAAMELNPTVLGDDWQIHLEKIFLQASED
ncbi:unnamed protein product [Rhodiola kirilowii]